MVAVVILLLCSPSNSEIEIKKKKKDKYPSSFQRMGMESHNVQHRFEIKPRYCISWFRATLAKPHSILTSSLHMRTFVIGLKIHS